MQESATSPDVIYTNGKIVTLDESESVQQAVAVRDGRFAAVGSDAVIKALAGPETKVVDLQGRTVVPGLIDAHCHPMETVHLTSGWVDCRFPEVGSVAAALEAIKAAAAKTPSGEWIFAAGASASQNKFAEKRLPTKAELDAAAPDNPALFANGTHLGVVNTAGLRKLGVKNGQRSLPKGAKVELDDDLTPTGVLTDAMSDIPVQPTAAEITGYYREGIAGFWNKYGFTSIMAITPGAALPALAGVAQSGHRPSVRFTVSVWRAVNGHDLPDNLHEFDFPAGTDPQWYRFAAVKAWVDGENDARTGYMCDPYVGHADTDPAGGRGVVNTTPELAEALAQRCLEQGVICMYHCSGDAAGALGLTAYEQANRNAGHDGILRIEHFGMFQLSQRQLDRAIAFLPHGLRISVQPIWLTELVKASVENMGAERTDSGFRFRTLIESGLEPAASTDMTGIYLGNINPFTAMHAAVTRESDYGVFHPEQAISVTDALRMWTIWGARAMGEGDVKGSIEPGKYADLAVLSDDILTMPAAELRNVKAVQTIVGGEVVYDAAG